MKYMQISIILLLLASFSMAGQTCFTASGLIIQRTVPDPITNFDFSYIDITQSGNTPEIFSIHIPAKPDLICTAKYQITLTITSSLNILKGKNVYTGRSGIFTIPGEGIHLSSTKFFEKNGPDSASINVVDEALTDDDLKDILLNSATVPEGSLFFHFTLKRTDNNQIVSDFTHTITIANIRYLRQITPGQEMGSSGKQWMQVYTPYPQFLWQSDLMSVRYANAVKYIIDVYEARDDIYSHAGITATEPIWSDTVSDINFTQYPVSGVEPLLAGKRYYWQVTGILQGPVNSTIKSTLYGFQLADLTMGDYSETQKEIMRCLELILGRSYAYILKDVKGLKPDEAITIDGKRVSINELAEIAKGFPQSRRAVTGVKLR
ncbi:MAG: hypothetical protein JNL74_19955 [Fibrobacteres bacterium]|nr:hypothetical protein [Fibrobacterota bacterium]